MARIVRIAPLRGPDQLDGWPGLFGSLLCVAQIARTDGPDCSDRSFAWPRPTGRMARIVRIAPLRGPDRPDGWPG
eukprot:765826-Prorocentrum_minimum.AAC.1